ncbi:hypothetical protein AYJ57_20510 (plasmid) [Salipiger sp. CCB-MM3]|uniref:GNAT family N-acetyltransferase n=1 Tax=Salipiger sp. CCB-MM3 TaxID=1792508 RepID=UPI00080AAD72|nr:GNAT family N-acetyltransferase [Salipiger sp. CCB-MM3]ANT62871.1 hypothetical protein AYJ57_20510 [Salipiger sp. CCB-MM3]
MITRPANADDIHDLAAIYRDFFLEDGITTEPEAIQTNLTLMLKDERACIFVCLVDEEIVGVSSGSITFGVEFGCAAELEDLYIKPEHRGRGWARKLATAVLEWAESQGATETILVITPEAEADQGLTTFYRKLGFEDSKRITMYRQN